MTHRWLHLRLASALMAFGGVTIDHVGVTREVSLGLGADGALRQCARLAASPRRPASGPAGPAGLCRAVAGAAPWIITDNQNARPYEGEPAWATSGEPECRNKGSRYSNPAVKTQIGNETGRKWITHRRRRDYLADHETRVVLRLAAGQGLSLDALAQALDRPVRPLFIGRKPCMPSARLVQGWTTADSAHQALQSLNLAGRALWPDEGQAHPRALRLDIPDTRNWVSGLHGGTRIVWQGELHEPAPGRNAAVAADAEPLRQAAQLRARRL